MSKLTLSNVGSLIDATTAQTTINANNADVVEALENTLSRDGTAPNTMSAELDMNSHQIVNLPQPLTGTSPLRYEDLTNFVGGGTISNIPSGGAANDILTKHSSSNYDVAWNSLSGILVSGGATGTGNIVLSNSPTLSGTVNINGSLVDTGGNITSPSIKLTGASSGTTTVQASSVASGTLSLPAATDTLVGKATTDTLTNKTFDTAGTGNSFSINGVAANANTGTGAVVRATSPTLVTPALGTPSSATLTNATGLPVSTGVSGLGTGVGTFLATPSSANLASALTDETGTGAAVFANTPTLITPVLGAATATSINKVALTIPATSATLTIANNKILTANNTLTFSGTDGSTLNVGTGGTLATVATSGSATDLTTGTLPAGRMPALTGDVTTSAGAVATTIANNAVSNAKLAQMATNTIKGNNTGGTANATDLTVAQLSAMFTAPTVQTFTSGSGTYTTPANVKYILVQMVGGGSGGSGGGTGSPGTGGVGGNTTFGSAFLVANGGAAGNVTPAPVAGGTASGGHINITGNGGSVGPIGPNAGGAGGMGGTGGAGPWGGSGIGGTTGIAAIAATANSGSGGGGGGANVIGGPGGAAGGYCERLISSPSATYAYAVGAGGTAGAGGTSGNAGAAGGSGFIIVKEFYQ